MTESSRRRAWGVGLLLAGLVAIGLVVWVAVLSYRNPTPARTLLVALCGSLLAPIGLALVGGAVRTFREPDLHLVRREAEVRDSLAKTLEEAQVAKRLKGELEAVVELRARRLELERQRMRLASSGRELLKDLDNLRTMEYRLDENESEMPENLVTQVEELLDDRRYPAGAYTLSLGFGAVDLTPVIRSFYDWNERRRVKSLMKQAPGNGIDK